MRLWTRNAISCRENSELNEYSGEYGSCVNGSVALNMAPAKFHRVEQDKTKTSTPIISDRSENWSDQVAISAFRNHLFYAPVARCGQLTVHYPASVAGLALENICRPDFVRCEPIRPSKQRKSLDPSLVIDDRLKKRTTTRSILHYRFVMKLWSF